MSRSGTTMPLPFVWVIALWSAFAVMAQQAPALSLEESLTTQYRQGTVLVIQADGVVGVNSACQVLPASIFKDGRLRAPGFVQRTVVGTANCDTRPFPGGTKVYLTTMFMNPKASRIFFTILQCDVADCSTGVDTAYKTQVVFEFPKGYLSTATLGTVQDTIKRVFSADADSSNSNNGSQAVSEPSTPVSPPSLQPLYVSAQNSADRLQLNADNSFSLQEGGRSFSGRYSVNGTTLTLQIAELQKAVDILIQGNQLVVNGDEIWAAASGGTEGATTTDSAAASVAPTESPQNDPNAMAARMMAELPSMDRIARAVRVFLGDLKQKGALPQDAFAVANAQPIPAAFDFGAGGTQPIVLAATAVFELRNATYECGSADSGPRVKSKKPQKLFVLSATVRKGKDQQWTVENIRSTGLKCSPTWQVKIPVP